MNRRRLIYCAALLLLIGGALALPSVHWTLWGIVRGEAFFQGRCASWWAREVQTSFVAFNGSRKTVFADGGHVDVAWWHHEIEASVYDRIRSYLSSGDFAPIADIQESPFGDRDALPVLLELVRHEDAKVRLVVLDGLRSQRPLANEIASAIESLTRDPDPAVREEAVEALTEYGRRASR